MTVEEELEALRGQLKRWTSGKHIYDGPDCVLCGHCGPVDEPEPCIALLPRTTLDKVRRALEHCSRQDAVEVLRNSELQKMVRADWAAAAADALQWLDGL